MATGHILPGYGTPVTRLRRAKTAIPTGLDRQQLREIAARNVPELDSRTLDRIRENARSAWLYSNYEPTTYNTIHNGMQLDEPTTPRPTSPTRRHKPHPKPVFLINRLHYVPGYHNPDATMGKEVYRVDDSMPEEERQLRRHQREKYIARPRTAAVDQYREPYAPLTEALGPVEAWGAQAWMKTADDNYQHEVVNAVKDYREQDLWSISKAFGVNPCLQNILNFMIMESRTEVLNSQFVQPENGKQNYVNLNHCDFSQVSKFTTNDIKLNITDKAVDKKSSGQCDFSQGSKFANDVKPKFTDKAMDKKSKEQLKDDQTARPKQEVPIAGKPDDLVKKKDKTVKYPLKIEEPKGEKNKTCLEKAKKQVPDEKKVIYHQKGQNVKLNMNKKAAAIEEDKGHQKMNLADKPEKQRMECGLKSSKADKEPAKDGQTKTKAVNEKSTQGQKGEKKMAAQSSKEKEKEKQCNTVDHSTQTEGMLAVLSPVPVPDDDFTARPHTAIPSMHRWMKNAGCKEAQHVRSILYGGYPPSTIQPLGNLGDPSTTLLRRKQMVDNVKKARYVHKPTRGEFLIHPEWPPTFPHHRID